MATFNQGMSDAAYYRQYGTGAEAIKARIRAIYAHNGNTTVSDERINDIYKRRAAELAVSFDTLRADIDKLTPDPPAPDVTKQKFGGQELKNIPGKPEVWKVGTTTFLVYMVPGTEADPVYLAWKSPSLETTQSFFGPGVKIKHDRILTAEQWRAMGVMNFGSTDEIPPGADDPFVSWSSTMATNAKVQPWILDDDYAALAAMALIEGRGLTTAEIKTTKWWQTHTAGERAWMELYHGDPKTAEQKTADYRTSVIAQFAAAGGGTAVADSIIDYITGEWVQGRWTEGKVAAQIKILTDPYSPNRGSLDAGLAELNHASIAATNAEEAKVRDLIHTWLGPAFGAWDDKEIARIAGNFRNNPNAEDDFIESLKDQRMALLPEYTDRELSYGSISNTWRQWFVGQWGEMPDEKDPLFIDVLKRNDMTESAKILRREGLARGVGKVQQDLSQAGIGLGSSVRSPV